MKIARAESELWMASARVSASVWRRRDAGRDACKSRWHGSPGGNRWGTVTTELISEAWIWNCLVGDLAVYRNTRVYDPLALARCP